jgi:hypothetical protein
MATLVDTSVLGRLANRGDAAHGLAQAAVAELHRRGEVLHITAQNLIEFRNFATRPTGVNGLGLGSAAAAAVAASFHNVTHLLTFNVGHFTRLASAAPGIVVLELASI